MCWLCCSAQSLVLAEELIEFAIERQALSAAILDFSYQSNVQVLVPSELVAGIIGRPVRGQYSADDALGVLLAGTNLTYEFTDERTVTLRAKPPKKSTRSGSRRRRTDDLNLEQLLVTADEQRPWWLDASIATSTLNGEDLESRGVTKADELQEYVPGLTVESAQAGNTEFSIRGVGISDDDLTTNSGVAVFIDEVPIPRQGPANMALYELNRVDVLHGPQSVLYSRNATGGALVYTTRKPSSEFEARYLVDVGNEGRFNNTLTVNGELMPGAAGQIAVASFQRDPIMSHRSQPGTDGNNVDSFAARGNVRIALTEKVEWLLSADTEETQQDGVLYSLGPNPGFQFAPGLPKLPVSDPERSADVDVVGGEDLKIDGLMLRANTRARDYHAAFMLAQRKHDLSASYDLDQSSVNLLSKALFETSELNSLEARFFSPPIERNQSVVGTVDWVIGVHLLQEIASNNKQFIAPGLNAGNNVWQQTIDDRHYAAYGQFSYWLNTRLRILAGARYVMDFREFKLLADSTMPTADNPYIVENFSLHAHEDWRRFTPKLAVFYDYSRETSLYASLATAYKPGGYPGMPSRLAEAIDPFAEERGESLEAGIRSNWFANRMKVNLAMFYAQYRDMQISAIDAFGNNTLNNAAETRMRGFELDVQARPASSVKLALGVSYIDARFEEFQLLFDGDVLDKAGDRVPGVPDATVTLSGVYFFPEIPYGSFSLRVDGSYSEEAVDIRSDLAWPSYQVFNLWLDFISRAANWEAALWVRNIADESYFQASSPGITAASQAFARKLAPPRLYGVSFKYYW